MMNLPDDSLLLYCGKYDEVAGQWKYISPSTQGAERDTLTFATFNIWFGDYYAEERHTAIANLLKYHQPDFIALQEVTPEALQVFLRQSWIQEDYLITDIDGSTLGEYGVVILSRLPLKSIMLTELPSFMDRYLLLVETTVNDLPFCVGTVHLESLKSSSEMRGLQLQTIFEVLENVENVVLMGDFNFCASWHKENDRLDLSYYDLWALLHPDQSGYTEDTSINRMRYLVKGKHKQVRFDRILLKSATEAGGWKASTIELLGTEPITPEEPDVFPSDHFGLLGKISKR